VKRLSLGVLLWLGLAWAGSYTVKPGDTLWRIAQEQQVDLTTLILANHLQNTNLKPGQELLIPEAYIILKGDTLWSLAQQFATSVAEIKQLNNLNSENLYVGQRLWIPSPKTTIPRVNVASLAKSYLGRPYRYGGNGPNAFDCSGYVQFIYRQLGVELPRTAAAQWSTLPAVTEPKTGDLVFFSFSGNRVDHVGIYLGKGLFIHANSYKKEVLVEELNAPWYKKVYLGARRISITQTTAAR